MPLLVIAYAHTNAGDSVRSVHQKEPTSALGGWILVHVLDLWLHLGTQARLSVGSESGAVKLGLWRFNGVTYAPNDNSFLRNLFAIFEKRRG